MTSSTGATSSKDRLIQQRRQQQDIHSYAASSRWYTYLSNAISFIDLAETSEIDMDRFYHSWRAIYNLYMMTHQSGEIENVTLLRWVEEITKVPAIRKICRELPTELLNKLLKAQNTLLKNAEQNTWRESKTTIETWLQKQQRSQELSPEKACNYTFIIGRDLRNAISHATTNPGSAKEKQAWKAAADFFLPLAIAAVEATIEQPLEGTTGRATAYRSFLFPFLNNSDSFFSDYYLEKVFEEKELAALPEDEAKEGLKQLNRELTARTNVLRSATDLETTQQEWYEPVLFPALGMTPQPGCRIVSEDNVYEPTYVLSQPDFNGTLQEEYQGKAAKQDLLCLFWMLPWRTPSLDAVSDDPEFSGLTVMEVAQRALLAADVPWAIVTNGQKLRLLRKSTAHKPRSFLEVNLEEIIEQRGKPEGKLAYRYFLGLFSGESFTEKDDKDDTRLERVLEGSDRYGQEISDELKQNVFRALEELGEGFLYYLRNYPEDVESYPTTYTVDPAPSENLLADIYQESLSLMYRLLFLFYAESLNLLPMENEVYQETYSLEALRDEIRATHDDPDPTRFFSQGSTDLWDRLKELFGLVNTGMPGIGIPAYNGGLFDPEQHPFLEHFKVGDYYLARAIDLLSRTRPSPNRPKGEGRKKVTYRDLDIRHLGSIYEGILEYSAHIADQDLVIMLRGMSGKTYEEYVSTSELKPGEAQQLVDWRAAVEEDPEFPRLPGNCKVRGVKEAGSYFLVYGGRESKRKSSGSYYTPDYIVQYIVENTLGPLVRGENREGELKDIPLTPDEILDLKVLDPAMGSAHFLVAATEFLAQAYGEAMIRTERDIDGVMSEEEFTRYKRIIAERCIYGVDLNPMAVELAKLSMWLFTMDRSRPLSFLNHHLKCGNALLGAWVDDLGNEPKFDRTGKLKRQPLNGQINLFEQKFQEQVPLLIQNVFRIMEQETLTFQDIQDKKILEKEIERAKRPLRSKANMWLKPLLGEKIANYQSSLINFEEDNSEQASNIQAVQNLLGKTFHWELEFPEVFFNHLGERLSNPGFNAVVGNPPYLDSEGMTISFPLFRNYCTKVYQAASGNWDLFCVFIEKTIDLCRQGSYTSLIIPNKLSSADYAKCSRKIIANQNLLVCLRDYSKVPVFSASVYPIVYLVQKQAEAAKETTYFEVMDVVSNEIKCIFNKRLDYQACLINYSKPWILPSGDSEQGFIARMQSQFPALSSIAKVLGAATVSEAYEISELIEDLEDNEINGIKFINSGTIDRYQALWGRKKCKYLGNSYLRPVIPDHNQSLLPSNRLQQAQQSKIIISGMTKILECVLDEEGIFLAGKSTTIIFSNLDLKYLAGLLNSKLIAFYYQQIFGGNKLAGGYLRIGPPQIKKLPIRIIEKSDPDAQLLSAELVRQVESMLALQDQLSCANKVQVTTVRQQIEVTDQEIDRLVYRLYDLSDAEISVVESAIKSY